MQWILKYWVAIVVGVVAIGAGVGLAMLSNSYNEEQDAGVTVDVEEKDIAEEQPDLILGNTPSVKTNSVSLPLPITLPPDLVPWETGNSDQTSPSTGGAINVVLPSTEMPWGTGPSQQ
ncbi:hypothetical protein JXA59_03065 [Patescibacteria group bacterium]|nr:hypothetical protein [Patescibacteria group bacterium]